MCGWMIVCKGREMPVECSKRILAPLAHFSQVDDKLNSLLSSWLFFAIREMVVYTISEVDFFEDTKIFFFFSLRSDVATRTLQLREVFPKKLFLCIVKKPHRSISARMNKYFLLLSDPQLSQKKFIVFALEVLLNEFKLQQWARLTTHKTLHSSKWAFFAVFLVFAIFVHDIFLFVH